jgi:hypothetical protein
LIATPERYQIPLSRVSDVSGLLTSGLHDLEGVLEGIGGEYTTLRMPSIFVLEAPAENDRRLCGSVGGWPVLIAKPPGILGIVLQTVLQFLKPEWVGVVLEVREIIRDGRPGDWGTARR